MFALNVGDGNRVRRLASANDGDDPYGRTMTAKALPLRGPLETTWQGKLLLKVGDNITTDHIIAEVLKEVPRQVEMATA